ncbi:hypothetical protein [Synechococcus sp. PCC 7336]|uniref:hypothetical protein n=1 Tax=Synechococcus sp. PCC 7336 TaxID=195250 RepID=UPI000361CDA6|nr:hypothetical protein [Synechococcus sp. PCC 7336]
MFTELCQTHTWLNIAVKNLTYYSGFNWIDTDSSRISGMFQATAVARRFTTPQACGYGRSTATEFR